MCVRPEGVGRMELAPLPSDGSRGVSWDAASEADNLFATLMGENVEQRRKYIEDHALEVKNLDI